MTPKTLLENLKETGIHVTSAMNAILEGKDKITEEKQKLTEQMEKKLLKIKIEKTLNREKLRKKLFEAFSFEETMKRVEADMRDMSLGKDHRRDLLIAKTLVSEF